MVEIVQKLRPNLPQLQHRRNHYRGPKKTAATEAIFANVRSVNAAADADPESLRLSVDTKAGVVLGDYSREDKSRGWEAVRTLDHDLATKAKLVPVGILEVQSGQLDLTLGSSAKTSDLLSDTLEAMTWKGLAPVVKLTHKLYQKGVRLVGKAKQALEARLQRSSTLPWYDILITPTPG